MAKVTQPLFDAFYEAFSNVIVFQRAYNNLVIARHKVRHPDELCSAHRPGRTTAWARAVHEYTAGNYPDKSLTDLVAMFALSPDSPKNLHLVSATQDPDNPTNYRIVIAWNAVTNKFNGWPLDNLQGYLVNFSTDGVFWQRLTALPQTATTYEDSRPAGTYYYTAQAIDDESNPSSESAVLTVEPQNFRARYGTQTFGSGYYSADRSRYGTDSFGGDLYH